MSDEMSVNRLLVLEAFNLLLSGVAAGEEMSRERLDAICASLTPGDRAALKKIAAMIADCF